MNIRSFRYTSKADQLQHMALTLVADTEARASAYARLGLFAMLMSKYPNTAAGRHTALVCDEWKQYR